MDDDDDDGIRNIYILVDMYSDPCSVFFFYLLVTLVIFIVKVKAKG